MDYMRAVPAALMRCLRTALVFAAAMAMSQAALGQTKTASHVIRTPDRVAAPTSTALPPYCNATDCDEIVRYTDTAIVEETEYYYYPDGTCQFNDAGQWSSPNDIQPQDNGAPAGVVTFSVNEDTPPPNPYTGQTCVGGGPYQYARLHFTWKLHKNLTAAPRGYGPTAAFSSKWTGKLTNDNHTFNITVPVVRPTAETTKFGGWGAPPYQTLGKWMQTLLCCDSGNNGDPNFDFSGEQVREVYVRSSNTCSARAGLTKAKPLNSASGQEATWTVQKGNVWGPDYVGFDDRCAMQYYRCFGATPCGITLEQEMDIKSPADLAWAAYTKPNNTLYDGIDGGVLVLTNRLLNNQTYVNIGLGNVYSQRGPNGAMQSRYWVSHPSDCPVYSNIISNCVRHQFCDNGRC